MTLMPLARAAVFVTKRKPMTHSRWLPILSSLTAIVASACVADPQDADESDADADGTLVHIMPMTTIDKVVDAAPAGAHLTNFGGPTLTHVSVHPVFWNTNTQFQTNINAFYKGVTNLSLIHISEPTRLLSISYAV